MASLRSLITSSPTGFELIPDDAIAAAFPRNLEKRKRRDEEGIQQKYYFSLARILKIYAHTLNV